MSRTYKSLLYINLIKEALQINHNFKILNDNDKGEKNIQKH